MALTTQLETPGDGVPITHLRFEKIVQLDHLAKRAEFNVHGYVSPAKAANPVARGIHVGFITFTGPAFDAYFSRQAIADAHKQGIDLYGQVYRAIKDWSEANKARRGREAAKALNDGQLEAYADQLAQYKQAMDAYSIATMTKKDSVTTGTVTVTLAKPVAPVPPVPAPLPVVTPVAEMLVLHASVSGLFGETLAADAVDH